MHTHRHMKPNTINHTSTSNASLLFILILCSVSSFGQSVGVGEYIVTSLQNELIASVKIDDRQTVLDFSGEQFYGIAKRPEKRKYFDGSDQMTFAVKYGDASFKLRNANEQLLWKMKIYDGYLKLSDNEEMTSAFRIAFSDSGKLKVKQDGEEQYAIRFDQQAPRFKAGGYFLMNFKNSLATGILLIEEIPMRERIVLASEVIRAGK